MAPRRSIVFALVVVFALGARAASEQREPTEEEQAMQMEIYKRAVQKVRVSLLKTFFAAGESRRAATAGQPRVPGADRGKFSKRWKGAHLSGVQVRVEGGVRS